MSFTDLLQRHPFNHVDNLHDHSFTDKIWADKFRGIKARELKMRTNANGTNWSPLVPPLGDDSIRRSQPSLQTNARARWVLGNEEDGAAYFRVEILSQVLSKFQTLPAIHERSFPSEHGKNRIDCALMLADHIAVIGEFKRNLIDKRHWDDGSLEQKPKQVKLARELRGYVVQYGCPQVFCFDIYCLMLLQVKAVKKADLEHCNADCWIFRRCEGDSERYPLRDALYNFLVQGIRRLQSQEWPGPRLGSYQANGRAFFSGEPLWKYSDGRLGRTHPEGFYRDADENGQLCWRDSAGQWVLNNGYRIPDSHTLVAPDN